MIGKVLAFPGRWSCVFMLFLFAFFCGGSLPYAEQMGMSFVEYILYVISDHYYLIYVWFFYLFYWSTRQITQERSIERVRYGSHRKYQEVYCAVQSIQLFIMVLLHIVVAAFVGLGRLKIENTYSALEQLQTFESNMEVVAGYSKVFQNPLLAVMFVVLYWWIGSQFLCRILFYSHEIGQKKGMFLIMFIALLSGMAGFVTRVDESFFAIFFFNNYFVLHHALLNAGMLVTMGILFIMIIIPIMTISISKRKKSKENKSKKKKCREKKCKEKQNGGKYVRSFLYMKPVIIVLFLVIYMIFGIIPCQNGELTVFEIIFCFTKGFSFRAFHLTEFLYTVVYFAFPLFWVNAFWEKEKENNNEIAMFRLGSKEKWLKVIETESVCSVMRYYLCYVVLFVLTLVVGKVMLKTNGDAFLLEITEWYRISRREVWLAVFVATWMRGIELLILYEISLLLHRVTKGTLVSFLVVFILYLLGFSENFNLLGLGSSSLYQILEVVEESGINQVWIQPAIQTCTLLILMTIHFTRRKHHGRNH